jgi:hypothetical protein
MTAEFGSAAVPFVKASACGNDFLIIEGEQASGDLAEFTRRVCDRRKGVGADGVEWLYPQKTRMWKLDSSTRMVRPRRYRGMERGASRAHGFAA